MRLKDRKINVIPPAGWFHKCVGATRNDVSVRFVSFCLAIAGLHLATNLRKPRFHFNFRDRGRGEKKFAPTAGIVPAGKHDMVETKTRSKTSVGRWPT